MEDQPKLAIPPPQVAALLFDERLDLAVPSQAHSLVELGPAQEQHLIELELVQHPHLEAKQGYPSC